MKHKTKSRAQRRTEERSNDKPKGYDKLNNMVKRSAVIFFICMLKGDTALVRPDSERSSPIFIFNIGNGAGLSMMFECEKALSDQKMAQFGKNDFIFGGCVAKTDHPYLTNRGNENNEVTQSELIDRVNETIDKCLTAIKRSINESKQVHILPSNRCTILFLKQNLASL